MRPENGTFSLFTFSNQNLGCGVFGSFPEKPLPPPPPCVEVLSSEVESNVMCTMESVNLDGGLTLLKGRVNTHQVFALSNSDLVPGKYEGGLKLWEGSLDLVKTLHSEIQNGRLSLMGMRVLEVGCSCSGDNVVPCHLHLPNILKPDPCGSLDFVLTHQPVFGRSWYSGKCLAQKVISLGFEICEQPLQ